MVIWILASFLWFLLSFVVGVKKGKLDAKKEKRMKLKQSEQIKKKKWKLRNDQIFPSRYIFGGILYDSFSVFKIFFWRQTNFFLFNCFIPTLFLSVGMLFFFFPFPPLFLWPKLKSCNQHFLFLSPSPLILYGSCCSVTFRWVSHVLDFPLLLLLCKTESTFIENVQKRNKKRGKKNRISLPPYSSLSFFFWREGVALGDRAPPLIFFRGTGLSDKNSLPTIFWNFFSFLSIF